MLRTSLGRSVVWPRCRFAATMTYARGVAGAAKIDTVQPDDMSVILTFSGKVRASGGSEIWSEVAKVMRDAGANIETSGGTFIRLREKADNEAESFSVSAFGACISPATLAVDRSGGGEEPRLGCTMFVKAIMSEERVPKLMELLQTRSPLQVYTASLSSKAPVPVDAKAQTSTLAQCLPDVASGGQTGSLHLFGVDRPGQLAQITKVLTEFQVSVSNLRVESGWIDRTKRDFVPSASGGPLAENRFRIVFNTLELDIAKLRSELQRVGKEVGYGVTCLSIDSESQFRANVPSYFLRRRAFALAYLSEVSTRRPANLHRRQRVQRSRSGPRRRHSETLVHELPDLVFSN